MDISTSNSAESQTDFDLVTRQLIPTDKSLQNITSKVSSTNTTRRHSVTKGPYQ